MSFWEILDKILGFIKFIKPIINPVKEVNENKELDVISKAEKILEIIKENKKKFEEQKTDV